MIKNESVMENATEFKPVISIQLFEEEELNMYTYFKVNDRYTLIQYTENYPSNPDDPMSRFFSFNTFDEFANNVEKIIVLMLSICSGKARGIFEFKPEKTATKNEIYVSSRKRNDYNYDMYIRILDKEVFRGHKDLYTFLTNMLQYKTIVIEVNEGIL